MQTKLGAVRKPGPVHQHCPEPWTPRHPWALHTHGATYRAERLDTGWSTLSASCPHGWGAGSCRQEPIESTRGGGDPTQSQRSLNDTATDFGAGRRAVLVAHLPCATLAAAVVPDNLLCSSQQPCRADGITIPFLQRTPNKALESPGRALKMGTDHRCSALHSKNNKTIWGLPLTKILSFNKLWSGSSEVSSQLGLDFWVPCASLHAPILASNLLNQFN